jgi:hypothetical protein
MPVVGFEPKISASDLDFVLFKGYEDCARILIQEDCHIFI